MKLLLSNLNLKALILVFALCYIMLKENKNKYYENLQNMDSPYLIHDQTDPNAFNKKIMDSNDPDLSGILQSGHYTSTYFSDNSGAIYDIPGMEKDIKYFNNVSHILADYYSKNMIKTEIDVVP